MATPIDGVLKPLPTSTMVEIELSMVVDEVVASLSLRQLVSFVVV